ncbi:hypothetical protein [Wolbachia endosymbiont of Litomosoides sigmodontis]|nr:hypothetical protein [Wolbachia endosymbiont of Litomosoides sigmodontis]
MVLKSKLLDKKSCGISKRSAEKKVCERYCVTAVAKVCCISEQH